MICYKGKVLTVDSNDTVAGFLVEDKGRIVYVGNELPEQYKNVQTVELGKKVLVPAFVDTHQHMASFSTFHAGLNVMDAESNEEIAQMVKEFVQSSGNKKTLIAFGASPYSVKEGRLISREELDKVCPDKGEIVMEGKPKEIFAEVETLQKYHLDVPQVTLLAHELKKRGMTIPVGITSADEMVDVIAKQLGK